MKNGINILKIGMVFLILNQKAENKLKKKEKKNNNNNKTYNNDFRKLFFFNIEMENQTKI